MTTASAQAAAGLRLHFNENTAGCSPAVLSALRAIEPSEVATYPDYAAITARVARHLGVAPESVLLTNGLDEGLLTVAQYGAWHAGGAGSLERRSVPQFIQVDPSFEMFEEFARVVCAKLERIAPLPDFRFPLEQLCSAIGADTRVVYLIDPNNPTGLPLPEGAAEAIAARAPHALVLVDEAYADFSGRTLIGAALERHANLVVGRTFAKAHGLAGLRVGALVAQPATIARLRAVVPPFNVNVCAVRALGAALDDETYLRWSVAQAHDSRGRVAAFCDRHGLEHWPSAGNFVLVRVGDRAAGITAALAARGIHVRDKSAAPGCLGCLRLTAGVVAHTDTLLSALEDILASRTN